MSITFIHMILFNNKTFKQITWKVVCYVLRVLRHEIHKFFCLSLSNFLQKYDNLFLSTFDTPT